MGPAAAVTAPRKRRARRSSPKLETVALQIIAAPQRTIAAPRIHVLRTRSARTPNGRLAIAATSEVTVTSRPMSVFVMWSACRSGVADAPTVEASALERARTEASSTITRVRSAPPSAFVSASDADRPRLPIAAAATPTASRPLPGPSVIGPMVHVAAAL